MASLPQARDSTPSTHRAGERTRYADDTRNSLQTPRNRFGSVTAVEGRCACKTRFGADAGTAERSKRTLDDDAEPSTSGKVQEAESPASRRPRAGLAKQTGRQ